MDKTSRTGVLREQLPVLRSQSRGLGLPIGRVLRSVPPGACY